jgi:tRNA threonylcarbamoyl adenosine modification protein YeaZ
VEAPIPMSSKPEIILYLDTASPRLMLGLSVNGDLVERPDLTCQPCDSHRYHSVLMTPGIQALLQHAGLAPKDVTALAVNVGPGSFTGIRTGVITARTMAQFLHVPVFAFNTFELLAYRHLHHASPPLPVGESPSLAIYLDALRGRSYHAALRFDTEGPQYTRLPGMRTLSPPPPPPQDAPSEQPALSGPLALPPDTDAEAGLLISPSLAPFFPAEKPALIPEAVYTPAIMQDLIHRYGPAFRKAWRDVRPLYLQEPSVTLPSNRSAIRN